MPEPMTPDSAPLLDSANTVADILHSMPVPLQFGDFAALGLTGWTPAGIVRWSFEIINVASGLPWFWTIVAGSAFWRLVCVPLALKGARSAAILQPRQAELAALQERVRQISITKNPAAIAKANREIRDFYEKLGVSPLGGLVGFLQLPITFGIFFAVKKMCDLPVEQMKISGLEMFPDLTVTDPTLVLPIAMTLAVNAQLLVCLFFYLMFLLEQFVLKGCVDRLKRRCSKNATDDVFFPFPHDSRVLHHERLACGTYGQLEFIFRNLHYL